MIYQAHKGVSSDFPENTMRAYRAAVEEGYGIIECDPKVTRDGTIVLLHDRTLNRTARLPGGGLLPRETQIADLTLAQARELDMGFWRAPAFAGERIPTLCELLALAEESGIRVKIDNVWQTFPEEAQQTLFRELRESRAAVGMTCNSPEALRLVTRELPAAELHYDGGDLSPERIADVKRIAAGRRLTVWVCYDNAATAWFRGTKASPELCRRLAREADVGVWILSAAKEAEDARRWGANIIETNGEIKPDHETEL